MARLTTNYGFNISEGNDPVNPLVDIFPNWDAIDSDLKDVSDASVGTATELTTGTVHALSRSDTDKNVFVFIATSNFTAGDTFTLDGNQVSALTPDGQTLTSGSYVIGATVLCALHDTLITVYVSPAKAKDADMLDGHDSTYYATDSELTTLGNTVNGISDKVGSAVLSTTAPDLSGAVNELDDDITEINNMLINEVGTSDLLQWAVQHYKSNSVVFAHYGGGADSKPSNSAGFIQVLGVSDSYIWIMAYSFDNHVYKRVKSTTWESNWTIIV